VTKFSLKYVQAFTDRYGQLRHYFRRNGRRVVLPGVPGSREFMDAYATALAEHTAREPAKREAARPGTFAKLAAVYFASANFRNLSPTSRSNYRRIIDGFVVKHGHRHVDQFKREHAVKIVGDMADRPGAAITLLKRLRTLIRFGVELGWITVDPTQRIRSYKSKEIHTWTEAEIAQFEQRWPIGSKQRLAFALLLYTGQRGSDVCRMTQPDANGRLRVVQRKTGARLVITIHGDLRAVLDAASANHVTILTTAYGQPFSVKGFGQFVSAAIDEAGLPIRCKAHGLRKAAARRLAEAGCSANEIMAVTGHKTLSEVERYVRAAEQELLNERAIGRQSRRDEDAG
jgi:enterobacteria phage integrase